MLFLLSRFVVGCLGFGGFCWMLISIFDGVLGGRYINGFRRFGSIFGCCG